MRLRRPLLALLTATGVSIVLALVMTALDWRKNPGGIFHSMTGTHWSVVADTFSSWVWPSVLLLAPMFLIIALVRTAKDTRSSTKK